MTDDARDKGALESVRGSARKEKVLHTRVPEVLAEELKRLAESMRVPVSNVVRTCLEDAVAAVSSMSHLAEGELQGLADRLGEPIDIGCLMQVGTATVWASVGRGVRGLAEDPTVGRFPLSQRRRPWPA